MTTSTTNWQHNAACTSHDPELFFPIGSASPALAQLERARQICRSCPVQTRCLEWAISIGVDDGIWGGLNEDERRSLRRRQRSGRSRATDQRHPCPRMCWPRNRHPVNAPPTSQPPFHHRATALTQPGLRRDSTPDRPLRRRRRQLNPDRRKPPATTRRQPRRDPHGRSPTAESRRPRRPDAGDDGAEPCPRGTAQHSRARHLRQGDRPRHLTGRSQSPRSMLRGMGSRRQQPRRPRRIPSRRAHQNSRHPNRSSRADPGETAAKPASRTEDPPARQSPGRAATRIPPVAWRRPTTRPPPAIIVIAQSVPTARVSFRSPEDVRPGGRGFSRSPRQNPCSADLSGCCYRRWGSRSISATWRRTHRRAHRCCRSRSSTSPAEGARTQPRSRPNSSPAASEP